MRIAANGSGHVGGPFIRTFHQGRWRFLIGICLFIAARPAPFCDASSIRVTGVTYVGKHFEVRDYDAPTKYIFNGSTRVARVTGSLSTNFRVQRVRVWQGWNLSSLAVTASNLLSQILNTQPDISAFRWDPAASNWLTILPAETLAAGTVLWLHTMSNATLPVAGTYFDPTNRTVSADGDYIPSAGLEVWDIQAAISNLCCASVWLFDAEAARWLSWLPPPLRRPSELPPFLAPGRAIFVRADTAARFDAPNPTPRIRYYHQDHLGSTAIVTGSGGEVVQEQNYYPFGASRRTTLLNKLDERYQFTQKESDSETPFDYFETRFLDVSIGRFLSVDVLFIGTHLRAPSSGPQLLNAYSYCANRPTVFHDPIGTSPSAIEFYCKHMADSHGDKATALRGAVVMGLISEGDASTESRERALKSIDAALNGEPEIKVDIDHLLRTEPRLRQQLITNIRFGNTAGSLRLNQNEYKDKGSLFAYGGLDMSFKYDKKTDQITVEAHDIFKWSPKEARATQCLHKMAQSLVDKGLMSEPKLTGSGSTTLKNLLDQEKK